MNYEFNLLHHVGVVAKRVRAAAAHKRDNNTPSGPTGRGVEIKKNCASKNKMERRNIFFFNKKFQSR